MIKTRREIREKAMQVLYAYEVSQGPIEMLLETIAGEELNAVEEDYRFAQGIVYAVLKHRAEADKLITDKSTHWSFERIALLDRVLLRMGIIEFLYFPDIPAKVTINECVEIAKRYSTEQSGRFINGLLDSILTELKTSERLNKTGRGLLDT
ncbi:MAG: transcription antitermination factor NusB [Bacteroidia bacterium]|nr:transcription antitermination factor NusB [Bacteroidia bacterium]